jgi:tripartite-type tricarboxylate transporter receptor subunit TctC
MFLLTGCATTPIETPTETPEKPIEFVIGAGKGGGADKFTRFLIGLNIKSKYIDETIVPVNKPGGAGAVAMLHLLSQKGNGRMMLTTMNNFVSTPLFQDLPFTFRDFTPIYLLALDNFTLWVKKDSKWKTAQEFIEEAKTRNITVGGTGSKQEDEFVFRGLQQVAGTKPFRYVPFKGGDAVAKALVNGHLEATVNQISEAGPFFPEFVSPLMVFQDERLDVKGYENVPTAKELGFDLSFNMMRGVFAPPDISMKDKTRLVGLFENISNDNYWVDFTTKIGLKRTSLTGDELMKFCEGLENTHLTIMKNQGWIR